MPRLAAAVYVQHPATREVLILLPGEKPEPEIAALVTNPKAWEEPPIVVGQEGAADPAESEPGPEQVKKTAPRRARSAAP
ncbi:hypothetical protein ACFU99_38805 [Streptomyces sp. NPDC057654]|uniref:hypothetical protein n=1 Tax=Streptomyces sp. NPDC057654 TaxID=3346196 RepID=UPI00369126D7